MAPNDCGTRGIRWNIPIFCQSITVVLGCFGILYLAECLSPYKPGPVWCMENPHVFLVLFVRPTCCKKPILASEFHDLLGLAIQKCSTRVSLDLFLLAICYGLYRYQKHHETPPIWEKIFGTLSKALPSTTATLHCLGGFEATNGQAMPSCTAAGARFVEDGFSFGKAGFGECT